MNNITPKNAQKDERFYLINIEGAENKYYVSTHNRIWNNNEKRYLKVNDKGRVYLYYNGAKHCITVTSLLEKAKLQELENRIDEWSN